MNNRDLAAESLQATKELYASGYLKNLPVEPAIWHVQKKARKDNTNRCDCYYSFSRSVQRGKNTKRAQFFDNVCKCLRDGTLPTATDTHGMDPTSLQQLWASYIDVLATVCLPADQTPQDYLTSPKKPRIDSELAAAAIDAMFAVLACSWRVGMTPITVIAALPPFDPSNQDLITTQAGLDLLKWANSTLEVAVGGEDVAPSEPSAELARVALNRLNRVLYTLTASPLPPTLDGAVVPQQFVDALQYFQSAEAGPLPDWLECVPVVQQKDRDGASWLPMDWPGPPGEQEPPVPRTAAAPTPVEVEGDETQERPRRGSRTIVRPVPYGSSPDDLKPATPSVNPESDRNLEAEAAEKVKMLRVLAAQKGLPVDTADWEVQLELRGSRTVVTFSFRRGSQQCQSPQYSVLLGEVEQLLGRDTLELLPVSEAQVVFDTLPGQHRVSAEALATHWEHFASLVSAVAQPPEAAHQDPDQATPAQATPAQATDASVVQGLVVEVLYSVLCYKWRHTHDATLDDSVVLQPGVTDLGARSHGLDLSSPASTQQGPNAPPDISPEQRQLVLQQIFLLQQWAQSVLDEVVGGGTQPDRDRSNVLANIAYARLARAMLLLSTLPAAAAHSAGTLPRQVVEALLWFKQPGAIQIPEHLSDAEWEASQQGKVLKPQQVLSDKSGGGGGSKKPAGGGAGSKEAPGGKTAGLKRPVPGGSGGTGAAGTSKAKVAKVGSGEGGKQTGQAAPTTHKKEKEKQAQGQSGQQQGKKRPAALAAGGSAGVAGVGSKSGGPQRVHTTRSRDAEEAAKREDSGMFVDEDPWGLRAGLGGNGNDPCAAMWDRMADMEARMTLMRRNIQDKYAQRDAEAQQVIEQQAEQLQQLEAEVEQQRQQLGLYEEANQALQQEVMLLQQQAAQLGDLGQWVQERTELLQQVLELTNAQQQHQLAQAEMQEKLAAQEAANQQLQEEVKQLREQLNIREAMAAEQGVGALMKMMQDDNKRLKQEKATLEQQNETLVTELTRATEQLAAVEALRRSSGGQTAAVNANGNGVHA